MHNFTRILTDKKSNKKPGALAYRIDHQPETTHDLLLQKSNGVFLLVLWGERYGSGGTDDITIEFEKQHKDLKVFDPTVSEKALNEYHNIKSLTIALSDHPVIVEIRKNEK